MEQPTGEHSIYNSFPNIVGIIFNNWTALKIAVEHGMGGPPAITQQKLNALVEMTSQMLLSGKADWCNLSDLLADLMDSEFFTILEDNSSDEVASHLCQLYLMFSTGDAQGLVSVLEPLPCKLPIHHSLPVMRPPSPVQDNSPEKDEVPKVAPDDDGWTLVKKK